MRIFKTIIRSMCLCTAALLTAACSGVHSPDSKMPEEELSRLDNMLKNRADYDAVRTRDIDSLKNRLEHLPENALEPRRRCQLDIASRYKSFCADSSLIFYSRAYLTARRMRPDDEWIDMRIALVNAMAASGIFNEAERLLSSLDSVPLSEAQLLDRAAAGRRLYSYMRGYLDEENEFTPALTRRFDDYDTYLRDNLPDTDPYRRFLTGEQLVRSGRNREAIRHLDALLKTLKPTDNLYGMATYQCALASKHLNDEYNYARYLALSAMSDVQGSVKETLALPALAQWLYDNGELDRAYRYINASLSDATVSNSRMRTVAIAGFLPIIDDTYRQKLSASRDELMIYLVLVALLLVTSGTLLVIFLRNLRRSNQIRRRLQVQTKMQENYIGHFLGLCASYADKLEDTRKLVARKIASGQSDELLKMLKNSRPADDRGDDFFKVFDETFLDLYPDFIDNFNALLRPEERIPYTRGAPLTTELRIYAFVRLGVQESVRIAQILRCSVSTIYTYRNRMRGRAIDRETFEARVATLGQ